MTGLVNVYTVINLNHKWGCSPETAHVIYMNGMFQEWAWELCLTTVDINGVIWLKNCILISITST